MSMFLTRNECRTRPIEPTLPDPLLHRVVRTAPIVFGSAAVFSVNRWMWDYTHIARMKIPRTAAAVCVGPGYPRGYLPRNISNNNSNNSRQYPTGA